MEIFKFTDGLHYIYNNRSILKDEYSSQYFLQDKKKKSRKTFRIIFETILLATVLSFILMVGGIELSTLINQAAYAQLLNDRDGDLLEDQIDPCPDDPIDQCATSEGSSKLPSINVPIEITQDQKNQKNQGSQYESNAIEQSCKEAASIEGSNTFASCSSSFEPTYSQEQETHAGIKSKILNAGSAWKTVRDPGTHYGNAEVLCQPTSEQAYESEYNKDGKLQ